MHLRTTNAGVDMCIRTICAYARCECKPTEENNKEKVIKKDDYKHRDQTKYRNSCMYIIGL